MRCNQVKTVFWWSSGSILPLGYMRQVVEFKFSPSARYSDWVVQASMSPQTVDLMWSKMSARIADALWDSFWEARDRKTAQSTLVTMTTEYPVSMATWHRGVERSHSWSSARRRHPLSKLAVNHRSAQSGIGRQHHPSHIKAVRDWLTVPSIVNSTYRSSWQHSWRCN